MSEKSQIARYRFYAEELRAIAEDDKIAVTATQLRFIADGYDEMARSLEAIAESRDKLKRI